jgi:crossover junction endodeoxyribonuclease RuvC
MHSKINKSDKVILGIDPGTNIMGYGLISIQKKEISLLAMGAIHLSKLGDHTLRLQRIFERISQLVKEFKVDEAAIEAPFYGKNAQSMLKLGRAQGVAMAAVLNHDVPISEYMPKKIKKAITGKGAASKEQVAAMLKSLVRYEENPKTLDATDALAVALCHYYQGGMPSGTKSYSNWDSFLKKNPGRKA